MPATDRLAKEVFEEATRLAHDHPTPDTYRLAKMAGSLWFGTQLGMAFINRGADGVRARQLLAEYESTTAWLDVEQKGHAW